MNTPQGTSTCPADTVSQASQEVVPVRQTQIAPSPAIRKSRSRGRLLGLVAGVGIVGGVGYLGLPALSSGKDSQKPPMSAVRRANLSVVVNERGSLESQFTVDGICELHGYQNKITYLVPEGTKVKKGDVVCKFDGSEIQKNISQQDIRVKQAVSRVETTRQDMEIQRNAGESNIIAATVELSLTELDLDKFQKGDYPAEYTKQEGEMRLKEKDVESETTKLEQYRMLMKKGFKTQEDVRIQTSTVAAKQLDFSSARQFLDVKKRFDHKRKTTELTSKVEQCRKKVAQANATARAQVLKATSEYEAAKATAAIEQQQLQYYLVQMEKTVISAGQGGIVAYANDGSYDASRQIREGATVYSRQKIFSLPDMLLMQVKTNIHESLIKKIRVGQKAEIRVDAFPDTVLMGTVKSVAPLADSNRHWLTAGVKEYTTIITLDDLGGLELKPGMTAETRIFVNDLKDVLTVPLQAVAQHKGEFYVFADGPEGLKPKRVKLGSSNDTYVQINEGIDSDDRVALDARSLAESELEIAANDQTPDVAGLPRAGNLARGH